jgi:hypothetical protein
VHVADALTPGKPTVMLVHGAFADGSSRPAPRRIS